MTFKEKETWTPFPSDKKSSFDIFDSVLKRPGPQRMFKCEFCPKTYTTQIEATRCHKMASAASAASSPSSKEKHECCNAIFKNELELQNHMKTTHQHQCNQCVAVFKSKSR